MYRLTLTRSERLAFDWVDYRYNAGEVMNLLMFNCESDAHWDSLEHDDITFTVPEHVAREIKDLADAESRLWPCFSRSLRNKLNAFLDTIV